MALYKYAYYYYYYIVGNYVKWGTARWQGRIQEFAKGRPVPPVPFLPLLSFSLSLHFPSP